MNLVWEEKRPWCAHVAGCAVELVGPLLLDLGRNFPWAVMAGSGVCAHLPSARAVLGLKEMFLSVLCHALMCPESGTCRNSFV